MSLSKNVERHHCLRHVEMSSDIFKNDMSKCRDILLTTFFDISTPILLSTFSPFLSYFDMSYQPQSKMTLSGIISTKTSKSPEKSRGGLRSGNKVSQNTFKNTLEDDLDTLGDIMSH